MNNLLHRFSLNLYFKSKHMDNKQLVVTLSKKIGREPKDINALIDGLSAIIKDKCGALDSIVIPGFGAFIPIKEEEKITTDLSTGKRVLLPPQISLQFRPSTILRKKITD